MAYGPDPLDSFRRATTFVDKILRGREARSAGRAADQIRSGDQPQDREGPRPHDPAVALGTGRSGDRAVRRRAFLGAVTGGFLAAPLASEAQQAGKVYRIGFLRAGQPPQSYLDGFQQGLRERGYVYGQNVLVELRATDGSVDKLPQLAEELVRLKVDVILASAGPAALAARKATTSVPVVFVGVVDPVGLGLVPSLGRPGGNLTGLACTESE